MERALAVIRNDSDQTKSLIREAGEIAAGTGADLYLLHVLPEEEYEDIMSSRLESDGKSFPLDEAEMEAEHFATQVGHKSLEGLDVEYEVLGTVGREETAILDVADERDCDHVFISGRKRSPSGKALFGDLTQRILLNFEGRVTVQLHEEE
ncbi:universal stress protein [Haloarchaeobius sp. HME9146]|uniref:universal stress protein n=1 Tax=Haloarchaeobius sp. HME9146 TaxID=2978732 RepID=UPI0021C0F5F0|nr:universal stress protein [Haloarchaeobius sp. HME9146]MCT9097445.1 universal stress protein [Haloarchaeobius sp. HME9146]